jgi:hypothetical protein
MKKRLSHSISVRLPQSFLAEVDRHAKAAKQSRSDWLRDVIINHLEQLASPPGHAQQSADFNEKIDFMFEDLRCLVYILDRFLALCSDSDCPRPFSDLANGQDALYLFTAERCLDHEERHARLEASFKLPGDGTVDDHEA